MTLDIQTILPWSEPREVNTRQGRRLLLKAAPTEEFRAVWRANKPALKEAGLSWPPGERGDFAEVLWWKPLNGEQLQAEQDAIEASRATDAQIEIPVPDGLSYMPFQKAGIARMLQTFNQEKGGDAQSISRPAGVLLADEMG